MLLSPQWSDLEGMNFKYQLFHLLFLLSTQHTLVRTLGSCLLLPRTGTCPDLQARENKNSEDTELAWISSGDWASFKFTAIQLMRPSPKGALASSAQYTSRLTQKSFSTIKNQDCKCKALYLVEYSLFSVHINEEPHYTMNIQHRKHFSWPGSWQKEVTSFPILNPDNI